MAVHKKCLWNVEMWFVDTFRAPRDNHINITSLTFVLHLLPATLTATSNAYPSSNTLINHLLAQMIQSTSHSSSHCSDSSNGTQYTPNADMYMGQLPSVQSAHIPYTGFTTYSYYPHGVGVLPNGTHGASPLDAPVAPLPGVGAGVAHPAFQAGPGGCYPPPTATAPTTQHPFAPPMCHQLLPSNSFPGTMTPDPLGVSHQTHLHQYHGAGLATGSPSSVLTQAPIISVGQKRVALDLEDRNVKRIKVVKVNQPETNIKNDPCFTPVLNRFGQHDGDYVCSKDGRVIRSDNYKQHLRAGIHVHGPTVYECHLCGKTFTRRKFCRKHWDSRCGKLLVAAGGVPMSYSDACRHFMSSASASLVGVPAIAFAFSLPTTATTSDSSLPESIPTEATEDSPNPGSGAAIEIQDAALVAPVLPPSEVREITLAEVHGSLDFWKWINSTEDDVEPSSSRLTETILAEDPFDMFLAEQFL